MNISRNLLPGRKNNPNIIMLFALLISSRRALFFSRKPNTSTRDSIFAAAFTTISPTTASRKIASSTTFQHLFSTLKDQGPYQITTPIYYVNDKPHIGHAYTSTGTYVLKRNPKPMDGFTHTSQAPPFLTFRLLLHHHCQLAMSWHVTCD